MPVVLPVSLKPVDAFSAKKVTHTPQTIATELDAAERITLFCLATGTRSPGNGERTRTRLIVKGLVEREGLRLIVTELGRAVLLALLASEQ
jgi:hypothetical protein